MLFGSDKTRLTILAGDKEAWPLYMSIGNIPAKIRNRPSSNAWVVVAYLPVVHFYCDKKAAGTLKARLFHQCINFIIEGLKKCSRTGLKMADGEGNIRMVYPRLAIYISDYPEQCLVSCSAANTSPTMIAGYHELDNVEKSPPRTYDYTLDKIASISLQIDPADVDQYVAAIGDTDLSGVDDPFWKDLPDFQPEICIAPDILHGLHRFWRDHILRWAQFLIGKEEFDNRLKSLQPVVGGRQFKQGISSRKQWSGREDREIQKVFLAIIAGAPKVDATSMKAFRAFMDFTYLAQYESHTEETIGYLVKALGDFHRHKHIFIANRARRGKKELLNHFRIPKLSAMHTYENHIREMGSSPQYSTDITEYCHRPLAKQGYSASNRKNFEEQMCRYLDRRDRVTQFTEFLAWRHKTLEQARTEQWLETLDEYDLALANELLEEQKSSLTYQNSRQILRAPNWEEIKLTKTPHKTGILIDDLAAMYRIPDLRAAIADYIAFKSNAAPRRSTRERVESSIDTELPIVDADAWDHLRIHLSKVQDETILAAYNTVQALPPSDDIPYGRCNAVLVHDNEEAETSGIRGALFLVKKAW